MSVHLVAMYPSFLNAEQQEQFERKGYVIFPSLLNANEVDALASLFAKHQNEYNGFFATTHFSKDVAYKKLVHDTITQVVFPKAAPHLNNFTSLFANFMIKNPDSENAMDLHADWCYVDEAAYHTVSIWVPLIDVNEENGCLGIIEGSHKVTNTIRGPLIRQTHRVYEPRWIRKYGKLLPMKAGDAIFYNHALLHYSPPNKTNTVRPAINLSVAPAAAPVIHYCIPEGTNEIEVYRVPNTDFFIHYNHFQKPETNTLTKTLPSSTVQYMDERMKWFGLKRLLNRLG